MKISTIFFDLGKVLVDYDFGIAVRKIVERSELREEDLSQELYRTYALLDEYECGRLETTEFFRLLKEEYRFEGTPEELREIWCDVFTPLDEHIQMARILSQHYPTAIISNISEAHLTHLEARYDFFPVFRERFYSFQVGAMKPDPLIYQQALEGMGADRLESLFIDDREENILAVSQKGWQTIHLRPDVNLRDALRSYDLAGI